MRNVGELVNIAIVKVSRTYDLLNIAIVKVILPKLLDLYVRIGGRRTSSNC